MNSFFTNKKAILFFILPALLLYLASVIFPLLLSFSYSLLEWDGIGKGTFTGFKNYISLLTEPKPAFLKSLGNSFYLAFLTIIFQLSLGLFFALVLAQGIKGDGLFRTLYFIPVILPSTVIGHLWKRIYDPNFGLLNHLLNSLGLENWTAAWLGDIKTALTAVAVPVIWQWIGYHMLLFYAAARSIPAELQEAAVVDGASSLRRAFTITIPLMAPVIRISVILAVIGSLKHFDLVYLMTGGGPAGSSEMPSTLLIRTIFHSYQYGLGSAMAIFIVAECLVLTLLIQKLFPVKEYTY